MRTQCFFLPKKLGIVAVLIALSFVNVRAGDAPAVSNAPATDTGSNEALRAYLQLQEQIHDTELSIERNRIQAQTAAVQESLALSNRLHAIEDSLVLQRTTELDEARRANHMLMSVIAIFAGVGFAAVLLMVYFQSRAVSRLAEISAALASRRGLDVSTVPALDLPGTDSLTASVEQSSTRLMGLVQHLEKRIGELEQSATMPLKESSVPAGNGTTGNFAEIALTPAPEEKTSEHGKLMEKGNSLLASDRPGEAVACFDEILAAEPNNAEALVKKGSALEKLRQPQEALECYDRAIAADSSLTIAYLHKGGLCSRLEKYSEAMECYERALHTQEKKQAA